MQGELLLALAVGDDFVQMAASFIAYTYQEDIHWLGEGKRTYWLICCIC